MCLLEHFVYLAILQHLPLNNSQRSQHFHDNPGQSVNKNLVKNKCGILAQRLLIMIRDMFILFIVNCVPTTSPDSSARSSDTFEVDE